MTANITTVGAENQTCDLVARRHPLNWPDPETFHCDLQTTVGNDLKGKR